MMASQMEELLQWDEQVVVLFKKTKVRPKLKARR
jgi:hypothetical protein